MDKKSFNSFLQIKEMMTMNRCFYTLQSQLQSIQSKTHQLDENMRALKSQWQKENASLIHKHCDIPKHSER